MATSDKRMLRIIGRSLRAGLMQHGVCTEREEGTPQGGPLSPLLANLTLDDLDEELEKRGHRFCRYADDCNIYVQSQKAGERVMGERDDVPGREASPAREPPQERGGPRERTQVPRAPAAERRAAGHRAAVAQACKGASLAGSPHAAGA